MRAEWRVFGDKGRRGRYGNKQKTMIERGERERERERVSGQVSRLRWCVMCLRTLVTWRLNHWSPEGPRRSINSNFRGFGAAWVVHFRFETKITFHGARPAVCWIMSLKKIQRSIIPWLELVLHSDSSWMSLCECTTWPLPADATSGRWYTVRGHSGGFIGKVNVKESVFTSCPFPCASEIGKYSLLQVTQPPRHHSQHVSNVQAARNTCVGCKPPASPTTGPALLLHHTKETTD